MSILLGLLLASGQVPMTRSQFEVIWLESDESVSAKLSLSELEDGRAVLVCHKTVGGTLFKLWIARETSVLLLESENVAYVCPRDSAIAIFPEAPPMTARQWLRLLRGDFVPPNESLSVSRDGAWLLLDDSRQAWSLRWRLKSSRTTERYRDGIFQPTVTDRTEIRRWSEVERQWTRD